MKKQKKILIDVGSSTVKIYAADTERATLLFTRSINFKDGFDPETGISNDKKLELIELIKELKNKYTDSIIKIYATAIFRKLHEIPRQKFIDEFFQETGFFFNIIPHDLESFYLEVALAGLYKAEEPVLLVNIGGGSTELVILHNGEAIERQNIEIGIGQILNSYKGINKEYSEIPLDRVVGDIKNLLPDFSEKVSRAIYNGGELRYMQLLSYKLQDNVIFNDSDHPALITLDNFKKKNKEVFTTISLKELESLMPEDPQWMHGARGCSAIAQAIFEKYEVKDIIPSNSNLIDGVVRQEFRTVTLSGSFRKHLDYIVAVKAELQAKNVKVLSPMFDKPKNPGSEFVVFNGEEGKSPLSLERHHLNAIDESDALIVCNPMGYVGASALVEIGYAQQIGKRIIYTEKPEEFMLNTLPSEVGL